MNEAHLEKHGWCEVKAINLTSLDDELIEIGRKLGRPVIHRRSSGFVQKLLPTDAKGGYPHSLTAKYSLGDFPLHVDTAHWPTPCRYVILGCEAEGQTNRETVLLNFAELGVSKIERDALFNAPFKIRNGRNSFYSTILSKNRSFIRYDPGCMTPATEHGFVAANIFAQIRTHQLKTHLTWIRGKIVVIDNWRVLHGREQAIDNGADRVLKRVLVA